MNKSFCGLVLTCLLPLSMTESIAATSGSVNLTGRVADGTCTISGMDGVINFNPVSAAEINKAAHGERIGLNAKLDTPLRITGCPAGMTKANLRFDYDAEADGSTVKMIDGSAPGVYFTFAMPQWVTTPGITISHDIGNGEAVFNGGALLWRNVSDPTKGQPAATVTSGTYGAVYNLSLSFE